ncbi:MAG: type II secretion system protein [Sulfurimonas sp.]|nr:type II secretion system protein [Sulfurimonas sp.]MBU1216459.1 type II secretion system GspH family protein [bacterium]MBU1433468.1 type II secretion system GspH family protein [bacterium]MBU1503350.1 type II secretion system GspH family protein [bacterium]MBU3938324.1 type II secretion system GspH family protein [bacterium]
MKRAAFSLIELMIVVMIMGVVYSLSINGLQRSAKGAENVTLMNLKNYMLSLEYEKNVRLLCLDECESCDILVDGVKQETLEKFLDKSVKTYRYEFLQGVHEVKHELYFNQENVEEDVCFSYSIDKQGVGEQVLVEYKKAVYDFTPYFSSTIKYASIQEAVNAREKLIQEVQK